MLFISLDFDRGKSFPTLTNDTIGTFCISAVISFPFEFKTISLNDQFCEINLPVISGTNRGMLNLHIIIFWDSNCFKKLVLHK